jgi:CDP-glucose 4,6-dehydratase
MENLVMTSSFWKNKRVLITGHTGFKGGWLAVWLSSLGADVHGFSLIPDSNPSFFNAVELEKRITSSVIGDIRDLSLLKSSIDQAMPCIIFHLAAQPLVIKSYQSPLETYDTNVIGTANLLETARLNDGVKVVVNVTTDKCYENNEWIWPYRETDKLGGFDPYSSSKACSEIITEAYRKSFFANQNVGVATARAGNVIGGGDWSENRLLPDFMRAFFSETKNVTIRNSNATRPWQHVLEPISGYLRLAERLYRNPSKYSGPWNFGPNHDSVKTVREVLEYLCGKCSGMSLKFLEAGRLHEAQLLSLDISKSRAGLEWAPLWTIEKSLDQTLQWYRVWADGGDVYDETMRQIKAFEVC